MAELTPFEQLVLDRHLIVMESFSRLERRVARLERDQVQRFGGLMPDDPDKAGWHLTEEGRQAAKDFSESLDVESLEEKRAEGSGEVGESSPIES